MCRKLFRWFGKDEIMLLMACMLLIYILVHIVFANHFRGDISLEEKILIGIGLVGSLLWIRLEVINITKIEYNDSIDRIEKLYFNQCRLERALYEKFNVVYRPNENGVETFFDKDEYYENQFKRVKKSEKELMGEKILNNEQAGYISKLSDLKKIIVDAEKLGLPDNTKIIFKDADSNEYTISNVMEYYPKTKKISLFVK